MNTAMRTVQRISVRGFHTSRVRLSGPHYPEGPLSNIPWTPKGKWNIRLKMFGYYGMNMIDLDSDFAGAGFTLPFIAAWWQLYGPLVE